MVFFRIRGTVHSTYIDESTGVEDAKFAEAIRLKREAELLEESVFGSRVTAKFAEAAVSYIEARNPGRTDRDYIIGRERQETARSARACSTISARRYAPGSIRSRSTW